MGAYGGHGHIKSKKNKQDWVLTEAMAISNPRKQKIGVGAYGGHGQIKSKKQKIGWSAYGGLGHIKSKNQK